ncbi:DUF1517 domain-containing protein [Prochlorococcus sp. MIT 1300]|uniref:DUF1517 domain-containing protein n=1 Tax=Prochlorococcus sp. MIT 1300 TaxID=3096218 RepID=UPI002A7476E5|nr:DUF1517 domain-containing protein [Prochlorococcus sp. MIT 1300]
MSIANKPLAKPTLNSSQKLLKRCFSILILPLVMTGLLLLQPQSAEAAGGGRIGGGSFRAPSIPRTGGYGGGYRYRGGGYGYRGGYGGGGMGFPFLIPMFGFGGGGLFGFLILMTIAGVLVNAVRGNRDSIVGTPQEYSPQAQGPITMLQVQIGLLASAKYLQEDLRRIAQSANTSNSEGLRHVLQETTLSLLRKPELWVYSNLETGMIPFNSAELTFNRLSMNERSKLSAELTSNYSGQQLSEKSPSSLAGEADPSNEYIVITILAASKGRINLNTSAESNHLTESLRTLGSIPSDDLMALEVIWQPEGAGEVLTSDDLLTSYPNLQHL